MIGLQCQPYLDPIEKLADIQYQLKTHVGKFALLREKTGRTITTYLIYLKTVNQGEYWCYDNNGYKRCSLIKWISDKDILTDTQNIVFLE